VSRVPLLPGRDGVGVGVPALLRPLCTIALAAAVALGVLAAPAAAKPSMSVTFEAPRDLLDPATRPAALAELRSLGVRSRRVVLYWHDVAPDADDSTRPPIDETDPRNYDWDRYDPLIEAAQARGWPVLMTVSGPVPRWATKSKRDTLTRPSPSRFQQFMTAVGRHYGGRVATWSIWNEPNLPRFLRPQFADGGRPASPSLYRKLYDAGRRGLIAAGRGNDPTLFGELAPRGTGSVVAPLTFLRGMLCLNSHYRKRGKGCGELDTSGMAHHAYTTSEGPWFRPAGPNDVTIGVLSRLTRALDRAARAGAVPRKLPIWLTEFGIQSTPDDIQGVSLARQAEYQAISERMARGNPRVAAFSQYLLRDDPPTAPDQFGGFESGLRFANGRAKPSLDGWRLPLSVRREGSRVSIWGRVRPATAPTTAEVQYRNGKGAWRTLRTVHTDALGSFSFRANYRSGRRWRLQWTEPDGTVRTGAQIRAYRHG
jgi:hypothetical protein